MHPQIFLLLPKRQSHLPNWDEIILLVNIHEDVDTQGGCWIWYPLPAVLQLLSKIGITPPPRGSVKPA